MNKIVNGRKFTLRNNDRFMTTIRVEVNLTEQDYLAYSDTLRIIGGAKNIKDHLQDIVYPYQLQQATWDIVENVDSYEGEELEIAKRIKANVDEDKRIHKAIRDNLSFEEIYGG